MPFPLMLAFRFLRSSTRERALTVMLTICFLSIMLGTAGLTLVAAIMNGFEKATHKKLQGIHADITLSSNNTALNYPKIKEVLTKEFKDSIAAFSPTSYYQLLIKAHKKSEGHICLMKVVDPKSESSVSSLGSHVRSVAPDPWSLLTSDTIFIGQALADHLQVKEGSRVMLLYPEDPSITSAIHLARKDVHIGAVYKTGVADFDERVIIAPYALADQLFPPKVTHVSLATYKPQQASPVISALKKRLSLDVYSWKDLYPQLLSALTLEKYAMIFILALITLVASMNIISLLFMYTTHKRQDIAILKVMGMTDNALTLTFVIISMILTTAATLMGIALAALGTFLLNTFPFIKLPDAYFVTHLPAKLELHIVLAVIILALFISIIAALLPIRTLRSLRIAHVLKGLPG